MRHHLVAVGLTALAGPAVAAPITYDDLIVFGDSLSDMGNFGVTFTNGPTWAGYLGGTASNAGGQVFAFGGAKAVTDGDQRPDLAAQIDAFAASSPVLGSDPLAVLWFGGNDLLAATTPDEASAAVAGALGAIGSGIAKLSQGFGIAQFVLPGLPDLGRLPGGDPTSAAGQARTAVTLGFNAGLAAVADGARASGLEASTLDVNALFQDILTDPAAFGFSDTSGTCQAGAIPCDGFVFWDAIHPTTAVHALVAERFAQVAAPVPLPAGLWLLGLGIAGLMGTRSLAARAGSRPA